MADIIKEALAIVTLIVGIRYTFHKGTELKLKNKLLRKELNKKKRRD
ncbi:hypothetical protein [Miniphocaeibacter massiliensis]|nr:hypothetical protein [Miniphocaeibacter massiliensis]